MDFDTVPVWMLMIATPHLPLQDDDDEDAEMADYVIKTQVREVKFLHKLRHPNIVNLIEDFDTEDGLFLVLEMLPENCLQALERYPNGLNPTIIKTLAQQLCEAVSYCHKNKVVSKQDRIRRSCSSPSTSTSTLGARL